MKHQSIALDFKAWRRQAGLTQADLAHLLSTRTARVSQIETGKTRPNIDDLLALSLIYGKPLEVIVSGLLDKTAYRLVARIKRMPPAPSNWREGFNRSHTLSSLAHRLESYSNREV